MENENKMAQVYQLIEDMQAQLAYVKQTLEQLGGTLPTAAAHQRKAATSTAEPESTDRGTVLEGVFDGQNMVAADGKIYTVPANYASKSKLVEGDIMKLTIRPDGSFVYKQIGPVKRVRQTATLVFDEANGTYRALAAGGRSYRLLTASVSYYKGNAGDTVVILLPEDLQSRWAAVENMVTGGVELPSATAELDAGASMELPSGDDMELPPTSTVA